MSLVCSRCHRTVEGSIEFQISSGCYDVTDGFWHQFARPGESVLCDGCMHSDLGYQKLFHPTMKSSLYNCAQCRQPLEKCKFPR